MSSYGQVYASQIASTVIAGSSMQAGATGNGNGTPLDVGGYATCNLAVSGTFAATVNFEASVDGSAWVPIRGVEIDSTSGATTATAAGVFMFNCAGLESVRARISDYVSGAITVDGYVSVLAGMTPSSEGGGGGGDINIDEVGGNAAAVGNGTTTDGTLRVTLSSDSTGVIGLASGSTVGLDAGSATIGSINNISGTVSLPTGAATSAKQPALGTAGTAASDVITVQGIASMTPLKVDASAVSLTATVPDLELEQDSATSGQVGPLVQGAVSTSAPSYINAKTNPLSLNTSGGLRVDASGTTVPISASSLPLPSGAATAAKQPALGTAGSPATDVISVQGVASGTALPVSISGNQAVNVAQIAGTTAATGTGASNSGTMRVVTSSDSAIAQTASVVPTLTTLQNAATGNGNGTAITTTGYGTCLLSITGSLGGGTTINFESSADGGTNWVSILGTQVGATSTATSTTSTGDWVFSCAAQSQIRARISSYGTGIITVKGFLSVISGGGGSGGGGGGSVTSNLTQINGTTVSQGNGTAGNGCQRVTVASDNTAFATIVSGVAKGSTSAASATVSPIDSDHNALDVFMRGGSISVSGGSSAITPATTTTYSASDALFAPASNSTDIWTMTGSSTKLVKILHIGLNYTGTAGGFGTFYLVRRSSANSGGTSSTTTPAKMDVNDSASTCTIKTYTANPSSLGTLAAQIFVSTLVPGASFANNVNFVWGFGDVQLFNYQLTGQPIILRGTSDILALNCGGTAPSGGTVKLSIRVVFTEE